MLRADLLRFWPTETEIVACLKTEAEAASEAVALAVHQPMRFEREYVGQGPASGFAPCDESEVLDAFLAKDLPEGRVILPIIGSSGVGKSHAVRWLHAQLKRLPDESRRVVIRIPKGTSLKGVLGILLKEVEGDVYDRHRRELERAQQELDPVEAAGLLCEMLAHTLQEMGDQAHLDLIAHPNDKATREREAFCRTDMLPGLLRNQVLRDQHFVRKTDGTPGVIKRLIAQLTEERSAEREDDRQHVFTVSDLHFADTLDHSLLGRAEASAIAKLENADRRQVAVRILNAALDEAKHKLLRVDPTVSDLFDAVRVQLLKEGKELILLVEDFAVLSGLQRQLLQVAIKEAVREGKQVLCTMRTALAYTTGYEVPETVLTRARVVYRIPDEPWDESEIIHRIERLVGSYLNAARLGQAALETAYARRVGASSAGWLPKFAVELSQDASAVLASFGVTDNGHELFPFNHEAIAQLADEGCRPHGTLVYNPRFVINNVITRVLTLREMYVREEFPPQNFGHARVGAKVLQWVERNVSTGARERYLRLLAYWGGRPSEPTQLVAIAPGVFEAFGFAHPQAGGTLPPAPPPPGPFVPAPESLRKVGPLTTKDPTEAKWDDLLESWRHGVHLGQANANQLRKWLAEAINDAIEWDWVLHHARRGDSVNARAGLIYIPQAGGNEGRGPEDAMFAVCTEADLAQEASSGRTKLTLMAVIRYHAVHGKQWEYRDSEEDIAQYGAFLDRAVPKVRAFMRQRYFRADWDPMPVLVDGLLIGARTLGFDGGDSDDDAALIQALLNRGEPESTPDGAVNADVESDDTGWTVHRKTLSRCRGWVAHVLDLIGARQGGAATVHAINVTRLKLEIERVRTSWEFKESLPNSTPAGVAELPSIRADYSELRRQSAAVAKMHEAVIKWREEMEAWCGRDVDKEALVEDLKGTLEEVRAARLLTEVEPRRVIAAIEVFRMARVSPALADAASLTADASRGQVLSVLGRNHDGAIGASRALRAIVDQMLAESEAALAGEEATHGANPLSEARAGIEAGLVHIERLLGGAEK
jgi:hypothetical protein